MVKFNFNKVAAISLCCSVVLTGSISAMPRIASANDVSQRVETVINNDLLEKHREIDEYVFITHSTEIANAGFKATNTGPVGDCIVDSLQNLTNNLIIKLNTFT